MKNQLQHGIFRAIALVPRGTFFTVYVWPRNQTYTVASPSYWIFNMANTANLLLTDELGYVAHLDNSRNLWSLLRLKIKHTYSFFSMHKVYIVNLNVVQKCSKQERMALFCPRQLRHRSFRPNFVECLVRKIYPFKTQNNPIYS